MIWTCDNCGSSNGEGNSHCASCGAAKPPPPASQDFTLEQIQCTSCGAGLDIAPALKKGQLTCGFCRATMDLSKADLPLLLASEEAGLSPADATPRSNIKLGYPFFHEGTRYRVSGRLRYIDGVDFWEAWFCVANDGTNVYLEEDGSEFRVLSAFTPASAPTRDTLESGSRIEVDGTRYHVIERGSAKITFFEGQLPWRVKPETQTTYVDARAGDGQRIAVEWTKRELEFYRAQPISHWAVASAMGIRSLFPLGASTSSWDDEWDSEWSDGETDANSVVGTVVLVVVLILLFMLTECDGIGFIGGGGGGGFGK